MRRQTTLQHRPSSRETKMINIRGNTRQLCHCNIPPDFPEKSEMELLKTIIISSEKAANIARLLRKNEKLFEKLVERKSSAEANPRFQQDFKTLADVMIQEMVKHEVSVKFPIIGEKVQGEENNRFFSSELNKEIIVEVKDTEEETANLLSELLDDDEEIANALAAEVHRSVSLEEINTKTPEGEIIVDLERLRIWIDPIDGTNEYVSGEYKEKYNNFYLKGIKCVTVLIGVYDDYGQPMMGVINQPFFEKGVDEGYQCHWGVCAESTRTITRISSLTDASDWEETKLICIGGQETEMIAQTLKEGGYTTVVTRGAGYKLLTVILGIADAYVLSKPTTYFWDTCGPQAILQAIGGNIVEMNGVTLGQKKFVTYQAEGENSTCNSRGVIAYRNENVLDKLLELGWPN